MEQNIVYVPIYTIDNGEGANTDMCIGVFSQKSFAYKAILDACTENTQLQIDSFIVEEFSTPVMTNTINVLVQDIEAHGATSTTVLGVTTSTPSAESTSVEYIIDVLTTPW